MAVEVSLRTSVHKLGWGTGAINLGPLQASKCSCLAEYGCGRVLDQPVLHRLRQQPTQSTADALAASLADRQQTTADVSVNVSGVNAAGASVDAADAVACAVAAVVAPAHIREAGRSWLRKRWLTAGRAR
eukprot:363572-Chlamydomonas_euryale.AAC.5